MLRVIVALAITGLVAACGSQPAADNTAPAVAEGTAAEDNLAEAEAGAPPAAASTPAPPASREAALALMKQRHEDFETIGDAMKASVRSLKASSPDTVALGKSAATIAALAPKVPSWFPAGTGPDVGKTEARVEIWQQPQEFAARARDFEVKSATFRTATESGDLAAIRAAHGELGKSCKACHDKFRQEDKH